MTKRDIDEVNVQRIYNDKADSYPQHVGKFFNIRIFIEFFFQEVKKILKCWVSGPYLYNKYQESRFLCLSGHFFVRMYRHFNFFLYDSVPPCVTQLPLKYKCKL